MDYIRRDCLEKSADEQVQRCERQMLYRQLKYYLGNIGGSKFLSPCLRDEVDSRSP